MLAQEIEIQVQEKTMNAELPADIFKWVFSRISETCGFLVDQGTIVFYKTGMTIEVIDSSHVAMTLVNIPSEWFENYNVDQINEISLNFKDLGKIVNKIPTGKDRVNIVINKNNIKINGFTLKTVVLKDDKKEKELLSSFVTTLETRFKGNFSMNFKILDQQLNAASAISDLIEISGTEEGITFYACDATSEYKSTLEPENWNGEFKGLYSLNFFRNIIRKGKNSCPFNIKGTKTRQQVENPIFVISGGNNIPLLIEEKINGFTFMRSLIAPRVEEEQDQPEEEEEFEEPEIELEESEIPDQKSLKNEIFEIIDDGIDRIIDIATKSEFDPNDLPPMFSF